MSWPEKSRENVLIDLRDYTTQIYTHVLQDAGAGRRDPFETME